jgi:hypothetical protein
MIETSGFFSCYTYLQRGYLGEKDANEARQRQQENPGFTQVPRRGFEPGSLVMGSKRVVHWLVRHGENEVRLQALYRASPQQPTPSVVKQRA